MLRRVRLQLTTMMAALLVLAATAVAGPFEDAEAARNRGDYATAVQAYRSLADQGHAAAQLMLGVMYVKGQGVPPDIDVAQMWFNRAAGNPAADQATRDDANHNRELIVKKLEATAKETVQQQGQAHEEAGVVRMTAQEFYDAYQNNEVAADNALRGKVIEIRGLVEEIHRERERYT